MDINVQATDNNVDADGGPKVTRNAEPIRLRIISESDLLLEIGKEQYQLATRLDEAITRSSPPRRRSTSSFATATGTRKKRRSRWMR